MDIVKLEEVKCLKYRLCLTEIANMNMQGESLMAKLDARKQEEAELKKGLFSGLEGDSKDWMINLEKFEAVKQVKKEGE